MGADSTDKQNQYPYNLFHRQHGNQLHGVGEYWCMDANMYKLCVGLGQLEIPAGILL